MRVNKKTKYGVEVLVHIANATKEKKMIQGRTVAELLGINEPYFDQIMMTLRRSGWVRSVRGRKGGYILACTPGEINILDVIELFEGPTVLGNAKAGENTGYAALGIWNDVAAYIKETLDGFTLQKVLDHEQSASMDYVI
ncbi:MAG: hypothetical protein CR997_07260 [Acidobacteria bacterium]|nr:MAG: hypothetical protein CR997_07260 [Acidobacteriota bacterium]